MSGAPAAERPWRRAHRAETLLRMGEHAGAIRSLRAILEEAPAYATARKILAAALRDAGRPEEAIAELETVLSREPTDQAALKALGDLLLHRGEIAGARVLFERLLELRPRDSFVREVLEEMSTEPSLALTDGAGSELEEAVAMLSDALRPGVGDLLSEVGELPPPAAAPTVAPEPVTVDEALPVEPRAADETPPAEPVAGGDAPAAEPIAVDEPPPVEPVAAEETPPAEPSAAEDPPATEPVTADRASAAEPTPAPEPPPSTPQYRELSLDSPGWMETLTIAEIYVKQGLLDPALGIFRKHHALRPDDAGLAERIRGLEEQVAEMSKPGD